MLDEEIEALREQGVSVRLATRSAVARSILTAYLECSLQGRLKGADGAELDAERARAGFTRAAAREVMGAVGSATEEAMRRATASAIESLPGHLKDAISESLG